MAIRPLFRLWVTLRERWPRLVWEVFAIMLGVLAAFGLAEVREQQRQQEQEQFYLEEIARNLRSDMQELQSVIAQQDSVRMRLGALYDYLNAPAIDVDTLRRLYIESQGNPTFFANTGGYSALLSSGAFSLLRNKNLASDIVELYENYYDKLIYVGTVLDEVTLHVTQVRSTHFSIRRQEPLLEARAALPELQSALDLRIVFVDFYLGRADDTLSRMRTILERIETELEDL